MAANTTIGISDPSIARQFERQTTSALTPTVTGPATVSTSGTATSNATTSVRSTAPVVSGSEVIYPQAVTTIAAAQAANSVTITQSANNESGDITTVYSTPGTISVTSVDQRVNQYSVFNTGVSEIIAGNNITISATIANGKGEVTINATGGNGDYSNSNVASYLPTYTGNVSANWILGDYISGNANPLFHIPQGNLVGVDGNASNVLYGNGVFAAAPGGGGGGLPLANGNSNINIATANGPVTLTSAGNTWTVGTDGSLTAPNNSNIYPAGNNFNMYAPAAGSVQFYTDGGNYSWSLDSYGTMNLPLDASASNTASMYAAGNLRFNAAANSFVFTDTGAFVFPTLTVDLHNGGNQTAQTLQFGDDTQQAVITGPTPAANVNAQRLIIQGQRGNGTGEGGDVYFWAGDADTNGGDIKIYAGDADNVSAGYGGYINLDGGSGFDGGGQITVTGGYSANGPGGTVYVTAGNGADAGDLNLAGGQSSTAGNDGGNANLSGGYGQNNGGAVTITGGQSALGLANYGNVYINSGASSWAFANDGLLSLPGGNTKIGLQYGSEAILASNTSFGVATQGANVTTFINWSDDVSNTSVMAAIYVNAPNANPGDISIRTGGVGNANIWTFGSDGLLTLPEGAIIDTLGNNFEVRAIENVNFEANAVVNIYTDGSNNAYQWQFDDSGKLNLAGGGSIIESIANSSLDPTLPNVSTMTLTPDSNYTSQILVLDPTAPGHIHLRAFAFSNIDEPAANIFLGGEDTAFEITQGANNEARIHSGGNTWVFTPTGSLNLATGNSVIQSVPNNAGDLSGLSTLNLIPDSTTGDDRYLIVDPTGPNHIHIRAGGAQDGSNSLLFLGGEQAYTRIDDFNHEVQIGAYDSANAAGYYWSFGNTGTLTIPGNLVASGASPAPSLSGFSSLSAADSMTVGSNAVMLSSSGNITVIGTVSADIFSTSDGGLTHSGTGVGINSDAGKSVYLSADFGNVTWDFGVDGNLTIPGSSGGVIKTVANGAIGIAAIDGGTNNPAQLLSINANGTPTTAVSSYANEATIQANINGSIQTWAFTNAGVVTSPVLTYANLSAATTAGRRAFISDANLAAAGNFGNAVSGGGANTVPVYSDGSVWRIG